MLYHIELLPGGQRNPGRVWRASKITLEQVHLEKCKATMQKIISTDARYTIPELAKATCISISKAHFILKKKRLHSKKKICKVHATFVVRRPKEGTGNRH